MIRIEVLSLLLRGYFPKEWSFCYNTFSFVLQAKKMLTMTLKVKSFKSVLQSISKSCNSSLGLSLLKQYVKMAKCLLVNETSINSYFTLSPPIFFKFANEYGESSS